MKDKSKYWGYFKTLTRPSNRSSLLHLFLFSSYSQNLSKLFYKNVWLGFIDHFRSQFNWIYNCFFRYTEINIDIIDLDIGKMEDYMEKFFVKLFINPAFVFNFSEAKWKSLEEELITGGRKLTKFKFHSSNFSDVKWGHISCWSGLILRTSSVVIMIKIFIPL